jgi:hypothetical protein
VKARKTYATQQCWRFLRLLEAVQHQNRARRGIGLATLHIFVALRGPEMQNANPKVGVLFSPSAV